MSLRDEIRVVKKPMRCFRFVTDDLKSEKGDVSWKVGRWNKHEGTLELCESGFHASRTPLQSLNYVFGSRWFVAEARGEIIEDDDKFVASEMRLVKEIKPLKKIVLEFSILCAERRLKHFEKEFPDDKRPRLAIMAARKVLGYDTEKNRAVAWSAAWSAGSAVGSAWFAAWSAVGSAWSAVGSAWSAAGSAERNWQERTLQRIIDKRLK